MSWLDGFTDNSWLRIMRHNSTTGLAEVNGTALSPSYTVANITALQAIAKSASIDGLIVLQLDNGMLWRYDHSITMWVVPSPSLYYSGSYGTIAAPTVTVGAGVTAATLFNYGTVCSFPANTLRRGSRIGVMAQTQRAGAAGAAVFTTIHMGTAGTASDSSIGTVSLTNTLCGFMWPLVTISSASDTILTSTYAMAHSVGTAAVTGILDKNTNINIASPMYINVGVGAKNTDDIYALLALDVWIYKI